MTSNDFRRLALSLPKTEERAHMSHPDFRVAGKIFATLGYPNAERGMVKVTPVEQEMLMSQEPAVFSPVKGAWGLKGCTSVNLKAAKKETMRQALVAAWQLAAPANLPREFPAEGAAESTKKGRNTIGKSSRRETRRSRKLGKSRRKDR
jgi:hypothetical protein